MTNSLSEKVDAFLDSMAHARRGDIDQLRRAVLAAPVELVETVKWNAPSYRHGTDDRVTFRLQPGERVEIIFHRGVKKREDAFAFSDPSGRLRWLSPDRAVLAVDEHQTGEIAGLLAQLVREWVEAAR